MCEFVARAAVGFASRGAPDPSAVLALLGAGVVVPAEAMALAGASLTLCDRCAAAPASKECGTCSSKMCLACDTEMHAKPKRAGHARLPLSVTLRLRLKARAARVRLLSRHSTKRIGDAELADAGGAPPEAAAAGERRSGIAPSSTIHLSSLGAGVGTAHNTFGFFAADVVLEARLRCNLFCVLFTFSLLRDTTPFWPRRAPPSACTTRGRCCRARGRCEPALAGASPSPRSLRPVPPGSERLLASMAEDAGASASSSLSAAAGSVVVEEIDVASAAVLALEAPLKDLLEGRFASLERYIAFLVLFHAMATRVASSSWPLPPWDTSRSQSILCVASTAAPISGAEVAARLAGEEPPPTFVLRRRSVAAVGRTPDAAIVEEAAAEHHGALFSAQ